MRPIPASPRCRRLESDVGQGCLDRCLRCLPPQDKDIVLTYYQEEGLAKIRHRAMVARQLKISSNALRLRIHRITLRLRECVFHCVDTARPGHRVALEDGGSELEEGDARETTTRNNGCGSTFSASSMMNAASSSRNV